MIINFATTSANELAEEKISTKEIEQEKRQREKSTKSRRAWPIEKRKHRAAGE